MFFDNLKARCSGGHARVSYPSSLQSCANDMGAGTSGVGSNDYQIILLTQELDRCSYLNATSFTDYAKAVIRLELLSFHVPWHLKSLLRCAVCGVCRASDGSAVRSAQKSSRQMSIVKAGPSHLGKQVRRIIW